MDDLSTEKLQKRCLETMQAADRAMDACLASIERNPEQTGMALLPIVNAMKQLDNRLEEVRIAGNIISEAENDEKGEDAEPTFPIETDRSEMAKSSASKQSSDLEIQKIILHQLELSLTGERETLEKLKTALRKSADASDEQVRLEEIRNFLKFAEKLEHS